MKAGDCSCPAPLQIPAQSPLFESSHWLYAFFRERVFRDHTREIVRALFPPEGPRPGTKVLELGCGPGFYSCRLASQFPQIQTVGVDRSANLLQRARSRATHAHLENCTFFEGDACALEGDVDHVDAVIVSRLFLIVQDRAAVLSEIHRVLRPGGRCFLAEPTTHMKTQLPLWAMRLSSLLSREANRDSTSVDIMSSADFMSLIRSQPWASVEFVERDGYQYAVCSKASDTEPAQTASAAERAA